MQDFICSNCDYVGPKKKVRRGSAKWEIFWWLSFPIGPFYSAWRWIGRKYGCPQCSEKVMVPVRSKAEWGDSRIRELDDSREDKKIEPSNPRISNPPVQW